VLQRRRELLAPVVAPDQAEAPVRQPDLVQFGRQRRR